MSIALWMKDEMDKMRQQEAVAVSGCGEDPQGSSDSVPSPVPNGRSKDTESRRWMLTLPESEYSEADVRKRLGKYKAVVGQLEAAPTTGYRHWQLYLEAKSAVRFSTLRKLFPRGYYKPAREPRINCVRYCTLEDKRADDRTLDLGQLDFTVKQGKRTDLDAYAEQIMLEGKSAAEVIFDDHRASRYENQLKSLELIRDRRSWGETFREVEVHYIHGDTRTGKTSALYETYGYSGVYRVPNWKNPFDAYAGQDILLLDEYTTSVPMVDMLKILEGYPLEVSARFADKIAKFTKVFIVSSLRLDEQHLGIQQEHPKQWEAFKARLTSISEMVIDSEGEDSQARLRVTKGVPPQLDHYLTGKPVRLVLSAEAPANRPGSIVPEGEAVGDEDLDDLFGDDDLAA